VSAPLFHLGDLLSMTTGRMLSPHGMDSVQRLLGHLVNAELSALEVPFVSAEMKHPLREHLYRQYPWLSGLQPPVEVKDPVALLAWLSDTAAVHGAYHQVLPSRHVWGGVR
jgi:hypothetical protein